MPIKASFTGDVSDLQRSTRQARDEFRQVATEADKTSRSLKATGSAFDGTRIEGAARKAAAEFRKWGDGARLTAQELQKVERPIQAALDKFRVMGTTVPQELQRVAREIAHIRALEEDAARSTQRATDALRAQGAQIAKNAQAAQEALRAQEAQLARNAQAALRAKDTIPRDSGGSGLSSVTGALGFGVGAGAGIGAVTAIAAGLKSIATEGAKLGPIRQGFEQMQGGAVAAERTLQRMRTATRGLSDDLSLMQAANRGVLLGLTDMGIDMAEVAGVATTLGRAVGQDAAKSTDDLTVALARQSPMILDNLGIKLNLTEANEKYAASLNKTVGELTEEEKKLAFATAAMDAARAKAKELGDAELTVSEQATRVGVAVTGMATDLASAANQSSILAGALGAVADGLAAIREDTAQTLSDAAAGAGRLSQMWTLARAGSWSALAFSAVGAAGTPDGPRTPGPRAAAGPVAPPTSVVQDLARARTALAELKSEQLKSIAAAKELGKSNAEAAKSAGTTEDVVRLWEAQQRGIKATTGEMEKLAAARAKLTGADTVKAAGELAENIAAVGAARIQTDQVEGLARQLMQARDIARQTGQAISADIGIALNNLPIQQKARQLLVFNQGLLDIQSGRLVSDNAAMRGRTAGFGGAITSSNPLQFTSLPTLSRTQTQFKGLTERTRDWRVELQGVAQAFAQMAQTAGPALDGVSRSVGTVLTSANAARELSRALNMVDDSKDGLTRGGEALAGGMAGLSTGLALGSLTRSPIAGGIMGGIGGGAAGYLAAGTGTGLGVGLAAGALAGVYAAFQNQKAQRQQLNQLREDAIAAFGSLELLQDAAERAGFSVESFMRGFTSSDVATFTRTMNDMNRAMAEQRTRAEALGKALSSVADVQGVLSQQQIAQIRTTGAGDAGVDAIVTFIESQREQTLAGIVRAAEALEQMASLTEEEVESLTAGVENADDRQRIITDALAARAGSVMDGLGTSVQATAAAIFVAIDDALASGERLVDVLRVLGPAIATVNSLFERSGKTPGAGFAQVQSYQSIATGAQTGPALELATGLGQALAGFANTGLLSPELFGDLANGIGAAYKQMELFGKGGLDAARLMQPALQAIWQQVEDFPGFEDTLDEDTRALLDFAEKSGLVGDKFRPAIDQMIQALDRLIARFDDFFARLAEMSGVSYPTPPDTAAPAPGAPSPGGGGGNDSQGGGSGGDYTGLASGGVVTRPTMALIGEGGEPEAVIPLSRWASMAGPQSQTIYVQVGQQVIARAAVRGMPREFRMVGV